jgi:hypothetical protein
MIRSFIAVFILAFSASMTTKFKYQVATHGEPLVGGFILSPFAHPAKGKMTRRLGFFRAIKPPVAAGLAVDPHSFWGSFYGCEPLLQSGRHFPHQNTAQPVYRR